MEIVKYADKYRDMWEAFIEPPVSLNGTFLHSRRFLDYHPPGRFTDSSLLFFHKDQLAAVIPACLDYEEGQTTFHSHKGSTFGGIVVAKDAYRLNVAKEIIDALAAYLADNGYRRAYLKNTPPTFAAAPTDLLDYLLFLQGYSDYKELCVYLDFAAYDTANIEKNFNKLRKRKIKTARDNKLAFRELHDEEISGFYELLTRNLMKFQTRPVHSLDELLDIKKERLHDIVTFFGCFAADKLLAAAMCFAFRRDCLHTQYLCLDYDYAGLGAMDFLDYNMITYAVENGFRRFSFGKCTEERGRVLNQSLAEFKESFGGGYVNNITYYKELP
ncbi:MAG: GNAT family N-acetyltransferase [Lachnospiraceae bacterium]|jgi:GNAT superfamily N-acetyltransferase|nr:GNAT family N-acetyltransferase [Lachnospiraceae bacterium]